MPEGMGKKKAVAVSKPSAKAPAAKKAPPRKKNKTQIESQIKTQQRKIEAAQQRIKALRKEKKSAPKANTKRIK